MATDPADNTIQLSYQCSLSSLIEYRLIDPDKIMVDVCYDKCSYNQIYIDPVVTVDLFLDKKMLYVLQNEIAI
jgi:hypothetical protein